jgi:hypothetical protein
MADDKKKKLIEGFDESLADLQDRLGNIASLLGDSMRKKLSDLTTDTGDFIDKFAKGQNIIKGLGEKLKSVQKDINKLSLDRLKLENDLAKAEQNRNSQQANRLRDQLLSNRLATQQLENTTTLLSQLRQQAEEETKITEEEKKQKSLGEAITKGLEKNFGITRATLKETFSLVGMIDMMVKGLKNANENSVWISKNLGYGAYNANTMVMKMQAMSLASNNTNITLKNAYEAMIQLATATGGVAEFTSDQLKTQIMLTKQLGLSADEAAGIYKFSVLQGKSSERVNDEMLAAFANTRNAVKGSANFKETMAAAAKVSGELSLSLKNNPAYITAAIVKAQALGTTLEQTKNQGSQLLDFESSISNELEAELMTGQQLNLEKARMYALTGDMVGLSRELANQGMTISKFENMNVLARQSYAKALGLTSDQLADQLNKQKLATEQGKSLAEVSADELKKAEERKTIQDRFNNMMEKLQDIVGSIGTLFMPIVDAISWVLDHSIAVYTALGLWLLTSKGIAANFKGIVDSIKNIGSNIGSKIMGKGATPAAPAAPTTPATGGGGGGFSGVTNAIQKINPTKLLAGAAALAIAAGAMFILGKAMQEFKDIGLETYLGAGAALVGLSLALAGLSLLGPAVLIGAGALLVGSAAMFVLGKALQEVGKALPIIAEGISMIFPMLTQFAQSVMPLLLIGPALLGIAAGLGAISLAGLLAMPVIGSLIALGAVAPALASIGIGGGDGGGTEENIKNDTKNNPNTAMITAINEVRDAVNKLYAKEGVVNIDGKKVGTLLTQGTYKTA